MKSSPSTRVRARRAGAFLVAGALAVGLAACGSSSDGGSSDGTVTIKFAWWGSDARQKVTQQVLDAFEAENPNINVEPDYTSWDNYFEKLNVAVAGGDMPDVITQEERYLAEYADRGTLADLTSLGLDTSKIDDTVLASGTIDDKLFGVPAGVNVHGIVADPAVFEAAGVAMPDDTTWTWEDYSKVAAEISAKSGGKYAGVQDYSFIEPVLNIYARQHGEQLFTEDGKVGVSAKTVESWFQRSVDQIASKAEPDASRSTEIQSAGVEGSLPATNTGGMAWFWSNQLPAISSAAGRDLVLLRAPGESEFKRTGQYLKPSMYYSVSSKSEHPEEAKLLVDFLVNSTQAGELILSDRGLPANSEVRDVVLPKLSAMDKVGAEYVESLEEIIVDGTPVPPVGSGEVPDITSRINSDVLFGKITPAEAAKRWISEVEAAIG
jgi:multiple sugar transport system substrate-binding protein